MTVVPDIENVVISVENLERSEDLYTSVMKYRVVKRGEEASPALERLWNLSPGTQMKWSILDKPEEPDGIQIRLVQFSPLAPRARYAYRYHDGGYADIHVCANDVVGAYKTLTEKGCLGLHEPIQWRGGGGELGVGKKSWYEAFVTGLDGEGITLMPGRVGEGPAGDFAATVCVPTESFSGIRDIIVSVSDRDEAYPFYRYLLGWNETGRWEAFGPDMEAMVRLPMGTVARPIFFRHPNKPYGPGLVIVDFTGAAKINLYDRNKPPYRGFIIIGFRTEDVNELHQRMKASQAEIVMPPVDVPDQPYRGAKAFSVRGPDGVFMEFIEKKSR